MGNPGCCMTVNQNAARSAWKMYMQSERTKLWLRSLASVMEGERDLSRRATAAMNAATTVLSAWTMAARGRTAPDIL